MFQKDMEFTSINKELKKVGKSERKCLIFSESYDMITLVLKMTQ